MCYACIPVAEHEAQMYCAAHPPRVLCGCVWKWQCQCQDELGQYTKRISSIDGWGLDGWGTHTVVWDKCTCPREIKFGRKYSWVAVKRCNKCSTEM